MGKVTQTNNTLEYNGYIVYIGEFPGNCYGWVLYGFFRSNLTDDEANAYTNIIEYVIDNFYSYDRIFVTLNPTYQQDIIDIFIKYGFEKQDVDENCQIFWKVL
jgi:hypothetical protein